MDNQAANLNKYPLRGTVGNRGQDGFLGIQSTYFTGLTGSVGTSYGIPGVTATRVGTGHYQVNHPASKDIRFWPSITAPSGVSYDVKMVNRQVGTGNTQFYIRNVGGTGGVFTGSQGRNVNPMAGTYVDLLAYFSPVASF